MRKKLFVLVMLIFSVLGLNLARAQSMVPSKVQANILVKMLEYDRSTDKQTGPIIIGVIAPKNDAASQYLQEQLREGIGNSFNIRGRQVEMRALDIAELETVKPKIVYLTPGCAAEIDAIVAICQKHKILSVTGVTAFMDHAVAIGLFPKESGTQIVVNLAASQMGGADFESRFLRISRVIKKGAP